MRPTISEKRGERGRANRVLEARMVLGLGAPELIVILAVALVLFGPKNLPKLGSAVGKTVKNFREGMETDDDAEPTQEVPADPDDADADAE